LVVLRRFARVIPSVRPARRGRWSLPSATDGIGFVGDVAPGDVVAVHWDWACDRLDPSDLARLTRSTRRELGIANRTI